MRNSLTGTCTNAYPLFGGKISSRQSLAHSATILRSAAWGGDPSRGSNNTGSHHVIRNLRITAAEARRADYIIRTGKTTLCPVLRGSRPFRGYRTFRMKSGGLIPKVITNQAVAISLVVRKAVTSKAFLQVALQLITATFCTKGTMTPQCPSPLIHSTGLRTARCQCCTRPESRGACRSGQAAQACLAGEGAPCRRWRRSARWRSGT